MRRLFVAFVAALLFGVLMTCRVQAEVGIDAGTNAVRASVGLPALATDAQLTAIAQQRANAIVGNFSHDLSWSSSVPCNAGWGENIAWHTGTMGSDWFVQAWVASPTHYENMVGNYTAQGSAIVYAHGSSYSVQVFAKETCGPAQPVPVGPRTQAATAPPPVTSLPDTSMAIRP